ncbi:MAG TPA: addiction module protein [Pirellulales bacterium]|nr:addiction module protein [Pirellulales bacterium]
MAVSIHDLDLSTLSPAERILLAQELWDMAHAQASSLPLSIEQRAEIERRLAAINAGTMSVHPWEEIKRHLRDRH